MISQIIEICLLKHFSILFYLFFDLRNILEVKFSHQNRLINLFVGFARSPLIFAPICDVVSYDH